MIIYMLAVAMTITMLIATVLNIHEETERNRLKQKSVAVRNFWPR